jgi:hypothetical protein
VILANGPGRPVPPRNLPPSSRCLSPGCVCCSSGAHACGQPRRRPQAEGMSFPCGSCVKVFEAGRGPSAIRPAKNVALIFKAEKVDGIGQAGSLFWHPASRSNLAAFEALRPNAFSPERSPGRAPGQHYRRREGVAGTLPAPTGRAEASDARRGGAIGGRGLSTFRRCLSGETTWESACRIF